MKKVLTGIFLLTVGILIGAVSIGKIMNRIVCEKQAEREKFRIMYTLMEHWIQLKQRGIKVSRYLEACHYNSVAIYGMSDIGRRLYDDLKADGVEIIYAIDRNKMQYDGVTIYLPEEKFPDVDVIIVTAIAYYEDIEKLLSGKTKSRVISLEDVINELL